MAQPKDYRASAVALLVGIASDLGQVGLALPSLPAPERVPALAIHLGIWLLLGLLTAGVWKGRVWAVWCAGILSAVAALLIAVSTQASSVNLGGAEFTSTPAEVALAWVSVIAFVACLAGIGYAHLAARPRSSGPTALR